MQARVITGESRVEIWRSAACRGKTHLFFAPPRERRGRRNARETKAKSYCEVCPLIVECREMGRRQREHGIWGGENDEQRAAAGFPPISPQRRAVAAAARVGQARRESEQLGPDS